MSSFSYILINVILPIFIQIGAGYFLQLKFKLNTATLSKLQFYVFIPALLFTNLYVSKGSASLFTQIVLIMGILFILMTIISTSISRIFHFPVRTKSSFVNSIVLFNSGNYCIPLITLLALNNPLFTLSIALSVQVVVMLFQTIMTNTVGVFNANAGNKSMVMALLETFKMPMIYAIIVSLFLRMTHIPVWAPIWDSLDIIGKGTVPLALITLGMQLANTNIRQFIPKVYLSNFIRLLVSPFLAFFLLKLFGIEGIPAQVVLIMSGAPSAVNSVLLALEYDNEPDLSSQMVLTSTIFSAITIVIVIGLAMQLFPILN